MEQNPQPTPSPAADDNALTTRGAMPASVVVALVAAVVFLAARISVFLPIIDGKASVHPAVAYRWIAGIVVTGLVIGGLAVGNRFAWQAARVLALVAGIFLSFTAAWVIRDAMYTKQMPLLWPFARLIVQPVCLFTVIFSLQQRSARAFFRLICPKCGSAKWRTDNFLCTRVQCRGSDCRNEW